jgi:hypothetical protein
MECEVRLRGLACAVRGKPLGDTPQAIPYRGRFFGKPLRAISRFSHQDA